ncbi:MAG: diaminopimelate decarboxylase [Halobacteria archaeon]
MAHLRFGGADTVALVERFGSPLYLYDAGRIRSNLRAYRRAFPGADIYYAAKANTNLAILKLLAKEGAGADVFSGGELLLAVRAGIPARKLLFNGFSKTDEELGLAARKRVAVSCDSLAELDALDRVARDAGTEVPVAFRVNPAISPKTHPKIATGLTTSHFGIPHKQVPEAYKEASRRLGVRPAGIHCHIGSQILDTLPFAEAAHRVMELVARVNSFVDFDFVDLGGGLGVPYKPGQRAPTPGDLAREVLPLYDHWCEVIGIGPRLVLEPGRSLVAEAGLLLTRVTAVKGRFVGVDAGFNLLVRPAMYDAHHEVALANRLGERARGRWTVVGPICETGDILARDRPLPEPRRGDLVALFTAGAYGFSMSSQYNSRPRCAEVMVEKGRAKVVRRAERLSDLLRTQA